MKKLALSSVLGICFAVPMMVGCGGQKESTVVEAPPAETTEEAAMEGMTDEEYDKAMDADMQN